MFEIRQENGQIYVGSNLGDWGRKQWHEHSRSIGRQVEEALRQGDFANIGEQIAGWFSGMRGPRPDVDVEITVPTACDVAVRSVSGESTSRVSPAISIWKRPAAICTWRVSRGNLLVKSASGGFEANGFSGRLGAFAPPAAM